MSKTYSYYGRTVKKIVAALVLSVGSSAVSADAFHFNQPQQLTIPEIGSGVGLIDQQKEKFIGQQVFRQVQQQLPIIHNPWLEDQLLVVFTKILNQAQLEKPIGLVLVDDKQINAFAVPGGLFAINAGLITSARTMDEVVGVMAHEVAHVSQRHYSRSQEAFKGQGLLALAGIVVGALIASQADSNAGSAILFGSQAALMDKQLNYSRNQEREADRIGMQYMAGAGYNPEGMADFFETMDRSSPKIGFLPDFWLTHPLTTERMSEARLRARQLPKVRQNLDQRDFEVLKLYTAVLSKQTNEAQLRSAMSKNPFAAQLALAALQLQLGDYQSAQKWLNEAQKQQREHNLITILQTDIYLGQNNIQAAFDTIQSPALVLPENRALNYKYAEVLTRLQQPIQAQQIVQRFLRQNPRDPAAWQLMQQAANSDKANPLRTVNVLRYRAENQYWTGYEEDAIKSLLHAQRLAKENIAMSETIKSRLDEMKKERQLKI